MNSLHIYDTEATAAAAERIRLWSYCFFVSVGIEEELAWKETLSGKQERVIFLVKQKLNYYYDL